MEPFEAETPHGRLRMANVIGVIPGRRADVILIGGHYDTKLFADRRFVGANDGGSSAALLLELARQLARAPRDFTYWIVFFDGEEARESWTATDSLYGSRRLAADLARAGQLPRAVIVADMIGDRDLAIRREAFSTRGPRRPHLGGGRASRPPAALSVHRHAGGGRSRAVPPGRRPGRAPHRLRLSRPGTRRTTRSTRCRRRVCRSWARCCWRRCPPSSGGCWLPLRRP